MFKNGDVICFLGDSITANGLWEAEAYQHIGKHTDIKCYNCGASGGRADLALQYLYSFCLAKNPTHVFVMFGVNDIDRWALSSDYKSTDVTPKEIIDRAIARYAEKIECITKAIQDFGSEAILCTPVPYDEYNDWEAENLRCDKALERCAEIVKGLADKYGCRVVDFHGRMLPYIKDRKPISLDRVHPTPAGYHMMGQIFLSELGEIDVCDFDTPFEFESWNKERFDVEKTLKALNFIEYVLFYNDTKKKGWGVPEIYEECKARYEKEENKQGYFAICYDAYIKNIKKKDELINELVKLTIYPRKAK